jgi:hypothetical protein
MPTYLFPTVAAIAAGCVSAFMLFWGVLSIFLGGPDARVGSEAIIVGVVSLLIGAISAYAARVLYTAPARLQADPSSRSARIAMHGAPFFALLFIALMWMVGVIVLVYFAIILALVLAIKSVRR